MPCQVDEDCCSNLCTNATGGTATCSDEGTQGCYCSETSMCAIGFYCQPLRGPYDGYCNADVLTTLDTYPATTNQYLTTKIDTSTATTAQPNDVCSNHGNYTCNCFHGYTGRNCENQIDFCNELITDYYTTVRAGDLCEHGTCITSVIGARCTCNPGFTGQFCQEGIEGETAVTSRCSMYTTNSTIEQNVPIGCPEQQICIPDHLTCAIEHACEEPFGWCIPFSSSTSNLLNEIQQVASSSKHTT
jgi:hypothetical protein